MNQDEIDNELATIEMLEAELEEARLVHETIAYKYEKTNRAELGNDLLAAYSRVNDIQSSLISIRLGHSISDTDKQDEHQPKGSIGTTEVIDACLQAFNLSPGTMRSYRGTWATFAKYYPVLPTEPEPVEAYLKRYSNRRTAADVYTKLGIFYKFAAERYGIINVMEKIRRPRFKQVERRSLKLQEVKALIDACDNDFVLALIHLWLGHGLRREEALRLNVSDIGEDEMFVTGKTKDESMPLLPETRELLLRLANGRSGDQPVFMSRFKLRLSPRMVSYIAKEVLERAGITGKGIAAHILRHSFSTLAQEAGMDFPACQRLMRHSKRTMTEHYTHFSSSYLKQQLEMHSPIRQVDEDRGELQQIRNWR